MRYEQWDVLLFPGGSKAPIREFAVTCHLAQDHEFSGPHQMTTIPTMTCFIPSLPHGSPFEVSVHSWSDPRISKETRLMYPGRTDRSCFEARLFVDGRVIRTIYLDTSDWPRLIKHESGDSSNASKLSFPQFHHEVLRDSYWSAADDVGRIKLVISEGFIPRAPNHSFERARNVLTFAFQHAPLKQLEDAEIAWPNPRLFKRRPMARCPRLIIPDASDNTPSHSHSPRRSPPKRCSPLSPDSVEPDSAVTPTDCPYSNKLLEDIQFPYLNIPTPQENSPSGKPAWSSCMGVIPSSDLHSNSSHIMVASHPCPVHGFACTPKLGDRRKMTDSDISMSDYPLVGDGTTSWQGLSSQENEKLPQTPDCTAYSLDGASFASTWFPSMDSPLQNYHCDPYEAATLFPLAPERGLGGPGDSLKLNPEQSPFCSV